MQKGQMEVWISSLPGFPDGISHSEDGNYWVAMAGPNQPFVKALPYRCTASPVMLSYISSTLPLERTVCTCTHFLIARRVLRYGSADGCL